MLGVHVLEVEDLPTKCWLASADQTVSGFARLLAKPTGAAILPYSRFGCAESRIGFGRL
jgi:hypothetical protein